MKKYINSILVFIFLGIMQANAIDLHMVDAPTNSCAGANVDRVYYISDDSYSRYLYDEYWSSNRRAISNYQSDVSIWQADDGLLSGCTTSESWNMASNISPGNNERVIAFGANCTFNKPTDRNKRNLQFVYNVGNYEIGTTGSIDLGNYEFTYYNDYDDIANKTPKFITVNNAHLSNLNIHDNECFNVELRYCGDGIITNGESCDPAHPDYNESTCSINTCTPLSALTPKISVDKTDANPNDLDANEQDSQTVNTGDTAIFEITVRNNGEEDLTDVVLTDPVAPNCNMTSAQTQELIKEIGNKDAIFNIDEVFTYTCEKENSQFNYVNEIFVTAVGIDSGISVGDDDPTNIFVLPAPQDYDLALRKTLSNTTPGPFAAGDTVTFDIRIINQGDTDAYNIEITDYIPEGLILNDSAWIQSGDKATRTIGELLAGQTKTGSITFTIDTDAPENIRNFAEISADDGDDCDSIPDAINGNQDGETDATGMVNDAVGTGCNPGGDEDDHDYEDIVIGDNQSTSVYLIKSLADGQATQVSIGDQVHYVITVYNSGSVVAENQRIEDHYRDASNGGLALVENTDWTDNNGIAEYRELVDIPANGSLEFDIYFTITQDAQDYVRNLAVVCDSSQEDCDPQPPVCDPETEDCCEDQDEIGNPEGCVVVEIEDYDLALRKVLSDSNPTEFTRGGSVTFDIEVYNQGDVDSGVVEITDYIPEGLTLSDGNWTQNGDIATRTIANIPTGDTAVVLSITFTIDADAPDSIENFAEISDDSGEDCDSIPDQNKDNDTLIDDEIGSKCEDGGDEDDHDIAIIELDQVLESACIDLQASESSARNSLTTTLTCLGDASVSDYKIEVRDSFNTLIETINSSSDTITLTTAGNYVASCFVNDEVTASPVCQTNLNVRTGGGGSSLQCTHASQSGSIVRCEGNSKAKSFYLKCGATKSAPKNAQTELGQKYAEFTCNEPTFQCYVDDDSISSVDEWFETQAWRTSQECKITLADPVCGNGIVESGEQCDISGAPYGDWGKCGKPGTSRECKLPGNTGGDSDCEDDNSCVLTWPNDGELVFGPIGNMTVGHNVNPLEIKGEKIYLMNESDYDFSFDAVCVTTNTHGVPANKNPSDVISGQKCFSLEDRTIFAWSTYEYDIPSNFDTNKENIPSGKDFGTENIVTTIKDGDLLYDTAYFAGKLQVKVARPAISTVGGGTSYIKSTDTADIAKITNNTDTNFVGGSVTKGGTTISSDSVTIDAEDTSSEEIVEVIDDSQNQTEDSQDVVIVDVAQTSFASYNGLENVYAKTGDFTLDDASNIAGKDLSNLSEPMTFIIDNGDLTISDDVYSNKNIAFVVRGGNIIIEETVENLDGTYITIEKNGDGGSFIGNPSSKQLVVNGSLYGDVSSLVDNRYYISDSGDGLSVGTIVSFGSGLFTKPAPLVSQFVGEYLESEKVAK